MIQKKDEELENKKIENEEQMKALNENYEKDVRNCELVKKKLIIILLN